MNLISHLQSLMDAGTLLHGMGPWILGGIAIIVFIESGVLFPFLPGDSLLVTATILRQDLHLSLPALVAVAFCAAFAGDQAGFFLGKRFGRGLFKEDARVLKTERLHRAEEFFARRGPVALVIGRFLPFVRTYVPLAAGTADMAYRRFIGWNLLGASIWVLMMTGVGLLLGDIPGISHSIDAIMLVIVGISLLPIAISGLRGVLQSRRAGARQAQVPVPATVAS